MFFALSDWRRLCSNRNVWTFAGANQEQVVTVVIPVAILALDVIFKAMFGNRDLHPFGGDLALCGFVLYLVAVLNRLQFGSVPATSVIIDEIFGIILALVVWFVTLFLGSLERWFSSLISGFLGLYASSLCVESAWHMLSQG